MNWNDTFTTLGGLWLAYGWIAVIVAGLIWQFVTDRKAFNARIAELFLAAERTFTDGTGESKIAGETKMAWVVQRAYELAPARMKLRIDAFAKLAGMTTPALLTSVAQKLFDKIDQLIAAVPSPAVTAEPDVWTTADLLLQEPGRPKAPSTATLSKLVLPAANPIQAATDGVGVTGSDGQPLATNPPISVADATPQPIDWQGQTPVPLVATPDDPTHIIGSMDQNQKGDSPAAGEPVPTVPPLTADQLTAFAEYLRTHPMAQPPHS